MKMKIDYIDHIINIKDDSISVIEIENKKYFYRIVKNLYEIEKNWFTENIVFFDEDRKEISMGGKVKIYSNYFELGIDSKRVINEYNKYVINNILPEDKMNLQRQYSGLVNIYKKIVNNINMSLTVEENINFDNILKLLKMNINMQNNLIDNLLSMIDIENTIHLNNLLVFINLKQYLNDIELDELYKYAIYNHVNIMLIDSQCYGCTRKYEKKLIIDENLEEFML